MTKTKKICFLIFSTVLLNSVLWAEEKSLQEKSTQSIKSEQNIESQNNENADVLFVKKLQTELEKGNLQGAIDLFENIPSDLENDLALQSLLAAIFYSNSNFDNAIKVANNILSVDKNNMEALELLSRCYKAKNNRKKYQEVCDTILAIDPYNPAVNIQKAEENVLYKKWKLARTYYSKALRGDNTNTDALFGYGKMSYYLNDTKTAEEYFYKVLDLDPVYPEALAYMGKIEYERDNFNSAVDYIKIAIQNDPYNYNYWLDLGNYLHYLGRNDEAIKAWTTATEIDPEYFLAYEYLAGTYNEKGNIEKALEYYHKVIETNPDYFYAYETTAILEYHLENYKEAIKYFTKAYEYHDSYSYSLMIAACYFKLNDAFNAKKVLEKELKKQTRGTLEYDLVRFFKDPYNRNAEQNLLRKIEAQDNRNTRCKMLFYMGLYNEINGSDVLAVEFYSQAVDIQAPMFFEYRIAEWGLKK